MHSRSVPRAREAGRRHPNGARPLPCRWVRDAPHGARGYNAREARGEDPRLSVLLHKDGFHIHGDGDADARVAFPILGLLASGSPRVDEERIFIQRV